MALSDKFYQAGFDAMKRRDFEEAEENFKTALSYKHDHSKTLLQYGLLLQNQRNDFEGAVDVWRGAAEGMLKNKYHVQMLCCLSVVLTKIYKDYDSAERYYKLALETDNAHVNSLVNYGLFLATVRFDYDQAAVMLKRAIRADPHRTKINNGGYLLQELLSRNDPPTEEQKEKARQKSPPKAVRRMSSMAALN
mmetsp:Transcript_22521/g.52276  ORF Transcript_22521/g.52276 Transcript_22521/m.52276 type:complete len:193 (+) Transcript_22521:107-685(+)|eukprot:CAMPEP_0172006202 /NCGR_PEP_ID=MMETSP1041-20130122/5446_1 /TAXON_ID=464988 /ORGANISM="Hemiselmis andersenii, Strain CCMP439" /LENGTH=192 /DNA_ID=CAMNT_0012660231 /DNA_START=48 /DNA_END=626 /DNA_ORIENTATION=+